MGFVFQSYNLLDALTAYDNVALPARLAGQRVDRAAVQRRARARSASTELAQRRPPELSGGQQQRVAIARALHAAARRAVRRRADRRARPHLGPPGPRAAARRSPTSSGQTVVMVTHDPLAASYAHSALFLEDGQVVGRLDRADAAAIATAMSELER